jgi:hypothetical protein
LASPPARQAFNAVGSSRIARALSGGMKNTAPAPEPDPVLVAGLWLNKSQRRGPILSGRAKRILNVYR